MGQNPEIIQFVSDGPGYELKSTNNELCLWKLMDRDMVSIRSGLELMG